MLRLGARLVQQQQTRLRVAFQQTSRMVSPFGTGLTHQQRTFVSKTSKQQQATVNDMRPSFITGFNTQGNVAKNVEAASAPSTQFKTKKPTTPGKRWLKRVPRDHLYKGKAVRALTLAKRSTGGRNNTGRITVRHRGGGHKRRIRIIDWQRAETGAQTVLRLEHDPGRTAWIALLEHDTTKKMSYIVAPQGLKPGDKVASYRGETGAVEHAAVLDAGNCLPLKMIPVGTVLHNIGLRRNGPAIMARSAGTYAQLIQTGETGYAQVRLSSGEVRLVPVEACATVGAVSNPDHQHEMLGKAGRSRWLGIRPSVRGMAMNACDHPHGGGRGKSKGNKDPRSPWGVLAKGGKTRKTPNQFVVKPRPRR
ncbi:hypothetical protein DFQ28_010245 [Apophysomyces sp. BC1034]|nr:hypothetical protein DFQ29_009623 [Apophysomyces sp. BC1021]KAG0170150.1 hypothetical protein DFQ30_002824 [Apophysomyces sp. BC1015]KAG0192069.1 hypothetical protein DFQ28_010245 [Apophysomyces sp. BC1034]